MMIDLHSSRTREAHSVQFDGVDLPTQRSSESYPFRVTVRVFILLLLMRLGSKFRNARVCGLRLVLGKGGCNPAPLPFLSLSPLFRKAVSDLKPAHSVLDMGSGCGVWALLASQRGARVTASDLRADLPELIAKNASRNGITPPKSLVGDLFSACASKRFDVILFNPPFHFGEPKNLDDRAYLGGANGELLKRFLAESRSHLTPSGVVRLILPRTEIGLYSDALSPFKISCMARQWMPFLGQINLLELRSK